MNKILKFSLLLLSFCYSINLSAQFTDEEDYEAVIEEVFTVVEKMPEFPGGPEKLYEYLGKNIKYPKIARESNVEGKVYVQFIVEENGSISDIKVARGVQEDLDNESIRVVKSMPNWTPGEQRGKKVRVKYTLPIMFVLGGIKKPKSTPKFHKRLSNWVKKNNTVILITSGVSFFVEKDGSINDISFEKSSLNNQEKEELNKILLKKGNFEPATRDGEAIRYKVTL